MKFTDPRLSASDATKINAIVRKNFPSADVRVESVDTGSAEEVAVSCPTLCSAAYEVAKQACEELGGGIPTSVCKLVAAAAYEACLDNC